MALAVALSAIALSTRPEIVAVRYIAAFNRHDGATVCSLFTDALRAKFDRAYEPWHLNCAQVVTARFGYAEESGQPVWRHARILRIEHVTSAAGRARVEFRVHHTFEERRDDTTFVDKLCLVSVAGRWRIPVPSESFYLAQGGLPPPDTKLCGSA